MEHSYKDLIFSISDTAAFDVIAIDIFRYQYENNTVYKQFVDLLKIKVSDVKTIVQIPFLPINFFKTHPVITSKEEIQVVFTSSGTTGSVSSKHFVADVTVYEKSYMKAFSNFYGSPGDYCILALLPSYLERDGSSLIYMVNDLIRQSNHPDSGFYLHNLEALASKLTELENKKQKTILIGVTYALLDLIAQRKFKLEHVIVMETGGMKGKRKELVREELHHILEEGFGVSTIHSEYGMTELLSQAYSAGNGVFICPPWMQVLIRDVTDPYNFIKPGKTGGVNIIDLANINSCSFIATQDVGRLRGNNLFEIAGRFDNSDLRGCNLLVQ